MLDYLIVTRHLPSFSFVKQPFLNYQNPSQHLVDYGCTNGKIASVLIGVSHRRLVLLQLAEALL